MAASSPLTLRQRVAYTVRLDESRLEHATDWLLDSIHQHSDNIVVGLITGVVVGHDAVMATAFALFACVLSASALYIVRRHVHNSKSHTDTQVTANERQFFSELHEMVK